MVEVTFEIDGKMVEPDSMSDALDILFLKHVREKINNTAGSISCPVHGMQPSILVKGHNLDKLDYEVSGCCDDLINKVVKKIK